MQEVYVGIRGREGGRRAGEGEGGTEGARGENTYLLTTVENCFLVKRVARLARDVSGKFCGSRWKCSVINMGGFWCCLQETMKALMCNFVEFWDLDEYIDRPWVDPTKTAIQTLPAINNNGELNVQAVGVGLLRHREGQGEDQGRDREAEGKERTGNSCSFTHISLGVFLPEVC
jgi:hypothetical protein